MAKESAGGELPVGHKPHGRAHPPGRSWLACEPHLTLPTLIQVLYIHISGEKNIREKSSSRFTIRSRRHLLFFLGRRDLESVLGFGEGKPTPSSSPTILHPQFHYVL